MKSILKRHEDGTIELTITIPGILVKKTEDEVIEEYIKVGRASRISQRQSPEETG